MARITKRHGNILDARTEAVVNTVNCVGVMGKGIALQFKQAYPENFAAYVRACDRGEIEPGRVFVYETARLVPPRYIVNFPTKRHWRGKAWIEDIERGLEDLVRVIGEREIASIAVPPLGCGNGGLAWRRVEPLIRGALGRIPRLEAVLYEPEGAPDASSIEKAWQRMHEKGWLAGSQG